MQNGCSNATFGGSRLRCPSHARGCALCVHQREPPGRAPTPAPRSCSCGAHRKPFCLPQTQRKLIIALVIAFIFMIVEVVGGVFAHSLAIITDAAHLLSDVSGFAVSVFAAVYAARQSKEHFSYG